NPYSLGAAFSHDVLGCSVTRRMRTIDLALLNPYFHGTTIRTGAPFWLGRTCPYIPTVSSVRGCSASSSRRPSTYGQSSDEKPKNPGFWAGNWAGSSSVVNSTYFAWPVGSTRLSSDPSGNPIHGITIDHASTQRSEETRSSRGNRRSSSSMSSVLGLCTSPSTWTVHGRGRSVWPSREGSSLLTPNS